MFPPYKVSLHTVYDDCYIREYLASNYILLTLPNFSNLYLLAKIGKISILLKIVYY